LKSPDGFCNRNLQRAYAQALLWITVGGFSDDNDALATTTLKHSFERMFGRYLMTAGKRRNGGYISTCRASGYRSPMLRLNGRLSAAQAAELSDMIADQRSRSTLAQ
jgi:L-rhamnose isomerase